jgi:hypothetical protein
MKKLLWILLLILPLPALAVSVIATISPYPTPVGHTMQINCKVNTGGWAWWVTFDASKTKVTKDMTIKHNDKLQCKVRPKRKSDGATADWSPIYTFIYKEDVPTSKGITKMSVK